MQINVLLVLYSRTLEELIYFLSIIMWQQLEGTWKEPQELMFVDRLKTQENEFLLLFKKKKSWDIQEDLEEHQEKD